MTDRFERGVFTVANQLFDALERKEAFIPMPGAQIAPGAPPPGAVDPATGMPMDPAAASMMPPGAPPPGAMDPATGMPMDPAAAAAPPAPPVDLTALASMIVQQLPPLLEQMGVKMKKPKEGEGGDSSGQIEQLSQRIAALEQLLAPLLGGGMPPAAPGMPPAPGGMPGMPMDPAAAPPMPPAGPMDPAAAPALAEIGGAKTAGLAHLQGRLARATAD